MKSELLMSEQHYLQLSEHLLPSDATREEAAFLLARPESRAASLTLVVEAVCPIMGSGLTSQSEHYLELSDDMRASLIKRAHRQNLCLIESHSHLGSYPAAFSFFDIEGLRETVRHMVWRLHSRPYAALVFTKSGYDGLIWPENSPDPHVLSCIRTGEKIRRPTNHSISMW